MLRFPRLSLAQTFLLVALAAYLIVWGANAYRTRSFINGNHPVLALSPGGKTLAMNCSFRPLFHGRHPVILLDTENLSSPPRMLESHDWILSNVTWSKDGKRIYSKGGSTIQIWDAESGKQLKELQEEVRGCLGVSPDERFVASGGGSDNPVVSIRDVENGQQIQELTGHKGWVWGTTFTPDGRYLVTNGSDSDLRIWDTSTWTLVNKLDCKCGRGGVSFTLDGKLIDEARRPQPGSKRQDVGVAIRDIPSGNVVDEFWIEETYAAVSSIALSPDGKYLAAAHGGDKAKAHSAVTIWNFETKEKLATCEVYKTGDLWIDAMEFSLDGETLFCATDRGRVLAHDWKADRSTVVFDRPGWPWKFGLLGGLIWAVAWRFAPRLPKSRADLDFADSESTTELVSART